MPLAPPVQPAWFWKMITPTTPEFQLASLLRDWPADLPALIYRDAPVTAPALAGGVARAVNLLAALGVRKGDRVALWLPNCPAWLELFFACAHIGAIAVSVNTRFRSSEVEDIVGRSGARVLVMWPGFRGIDFLSVLSDVNTAALAQLEHILIYGEEGITDLSWPGCQQVQSYLAARDRMSPETDPPAAGEDDGCAVFTTSGTTKAPKFVLHTHRSVVHHAEDAATLLRYREADVVLLLAIPLCGVYGFCQMMAGLAARRPTVVMPFFDADDAADQIRRHRVTHMNGTDDMFGPILARGEGSRPFPSLRQCGFASFNGDPVETVALGDAAGIPFVGRYGMSEVQALFAAQPEDADAAQRALGGGRPVSPEAEVRVRDPDSGALLPHGEAGELELKGPSLMAGYFGDPAATADAFTDDGFIRSGDLGYLTEDGFVFVARMGDAMRLGGFLVSPAEISARIDELPDVVASQVVAVPKGGRPRPVAFVQVNSTGSLPAGWERDVIDHCARGLAAYKVPVRVVPVNSFPITESANGVKVQRSRLREMAAALFR